ncbi:MAG: hypothetical protein SOU08_05315 [Anaerococcus sp.]|nr:hypothetical protein [Anaerococcus sp.]MDD7044360.1 hypothetical protein [Peptoniphilaceae bacterium]MDY2919040.1 hypothetical protein [Anaerococcus sp.]
MKGPIDRFKEKNSEYVYEKQSLLDKDNLEKGDRLAMFLAAMKTFMPVVLLVLSPLILLAIFL